MFTADVKVEYANKAVEAAGLVSFSPYLIDMITFFHYVSQADSQSRNRPQMHRRRHPRNRASPPLQAARQGRQQADTISR